MVIRSDILKKHFEKLGFDEDFFNTYESSAADVMQNIDTMITALYVAYLNKDEIVIYTDFDVDGIMSSIIAYAGMSELGFNVKLAKPSPSNGYGFHISDVDNILSQYPNACIIFTGDVGIGNNEAIDYAHNKGLKVYVTDHHISDSLCNADIALNPNQFGETYSHNNICGSVVIYQLLQAYANTYCNATVCVDISRLQMFAGIATISDVMPLLYENRQIVRNSIAMMRYFYNYELTNDTLAPPVYSDNYSRAFVGMKKLLEYFTVTGKLKSSADIDVQFYGYYLVPLLNSCKRMDGDMSGIYDIFFCPIVKMLPSFTNMACVENAINYIVDLNAQRKELTAEYFSTLYELKNNPDTSFVSTCMNCEVYITTASAGLLGLLATKFINLSGLPTLVIRQNPDGTFVGSGRNPSWFSFLRTAQASVQGLIAAGHEEAFGVSFSNIDAVAAYCEFFKTVVLAEYDFALTNGFLVSDTTISISNRIGVDCDFYCDADLISAYLEEKTMFQPFGKAFPEPSFVFYIDTHNADVSMFGNLKQHVRLVTENGIEVMFFNQAIDYESFIYYNRDGDGLMACYGSFRFDTFNDEQYDTISFFVDSFNKA